MKKLLIALLLLLTAPAHAGTLTYCTQIESKTLSGSATGSIVEFAAQNYKSMSAVLTWANGAGSTPTLDVKLQSCRTKSTSSCKDWPTSSQIFSQHTTDSGVDIVDVNLETVNNWKYFRAVSTVGGTSSPTYTYTVELCVDSSNR